VVVGSGIAGLSTSLALSELIPAARLLLVTKSELRASATAWAQGGIAAVMPDARDDSPDAHEADTLAAGGGLCDTEAVRTMVSAAPEAISALTKWGTEFDRDPDGSWALSREGGHSRPRVLHSGGTATGAEIERALAKATEAARIPTLTGTSAIELLLDAGGVAGLTLQSDSGNRFHQPCRTVILATGGVGNLFSVTTNPAVATGDGLALALRAGALLSDVEFVQFHPTALHTPVTPRPLLSEALRGHGAQLRGPDGNRFVDELAPRDVVSRAIFEVMDATAATHVWLDATSISGFATRFVNLAETLRQLGLDPSRDWLPVAPAAHHLSGGVATDLDGATSVPGLFAVGEVADTGVHGANRLASNSLLEAVVFAARAARAIRDGKMSAEPTGLMAGVPRLRASSRPTVSWPVMVQVPELTQVRGTVSEADASINSVRQRLAEAMMSGVGVARTEKSLIQARQDLEAMAAMLPAGQSVGHHVVANLLDVGRVLIQAALTRRESRGGHLRLDYRESDDRWLCRLGWSVR
jgi:L-aspartate oxidase